MFKREAASLVFCAPSGGGERGPEGALDRAAVCGPVFGHAHGAAPGCVGEISRSSVRTATRASPIAASAAVIGATAAAMKAEK
ncbi:hypothetical protein ABXV03_19315 [Streptomyces harbinensis]|uniref:hypothetical protein n=1 Tax=Streptomyces harbinensis TaxID=1176198 RepID=UPI003397B1BC